MKKEKLTEIYCNYCGELKIIKKSDLKKFKKCIFCGSKDINEV